MKDILTLGHGTTTFSLLDIGTAWGSSPVRPQLGFAPGFRTTRTEAHGPGYFYIGRHFVIPTS
jgi:hypothetical protein